MKIFFDLEFTGLHQKTTPISLGLVSDSGVTFYAEFTDFDHDQIDDWIRKNVLKNLVLKDWMSPTNNEYVIEKDNNMKVKGGRLKVVQHLARWLDKFNEQITLVSDCLPYDYVLFCELFGGSMNLPKKLSYIPIDICTMFVMKGIDPDISREEFSGIHLTKHNALDDAIVIRECYRKLSE